MLIYIHVFWNKGFRINEIPIGSYNKQYAENLRSQTSISNMLIFGDGLYNTCRVIANLRAGRLKSEFIF